MSRKTRPVACDKLGIIYPSVRIAAEDNGLDAMTLYHTCAGTHNMRQYAKSAWGFVGGVSFNGFAMVRGTKPFKIPGPFAGRKHTAETKARMSAAKDLKKRPVAAYLPNGTLHAVYSSMREAVIQVTGSPVNQRGFTNSVSSAVKKRQKRFGFYWKDA